MTNPNPNAKEIVTGATDEEARILLEEIYLDKLVRVFEANTTDCAEEHRAADELMCQALEALDWPSFVTLYRKGHNERGWSYD